MQTREKSAIFRTLESNGVTYVHLFQNLGEKWREKFQCLENELSQRSPDAIF